MNYEEAEKIYHISKGLNNELSKPIILVDCMDTVVSRNITLGGIFRKWSKQVGKEFGINHKYLELYRRNVASGAMHNTVSIEMIYREIAEQCIYFKILDKSKKRIFCLRSHEIEMDIELSSQKKLPKTVEFLKKEKLLNRQIYCVSDFRLPSSDIQKFFQKEKIGDIFNGVFSSSDAGLTKKDGSFYKYVLDKLQVKSDDCIMIGDNFKSDCINAAKNGIRGYWLTNIKSD